jgi:hypothetical protein
VEGIELIESANIDNYVWRPILHDPQLCTLRELQDGTYNINDLADMHEAMDEEAEYQRLLELKHKPKK